MKTIYETIAIFFFYLRVYVNIYIDETKKVNMRVYEGKKIFCTIANSALICILKYNIIENAIFSSTFDANRYCFALNYYYVPACCTTQSPHYTHTHDTLTINTTMYILVTVQSDRLRPDYTLHIVCKDV